MSSFALTYTDNPETDALVARRERTGGPAGHLLKQRSGTMAEANDSKRRTLPGTARAAGL